MNSFAVVDRSDFPSARFAFDFALFVCAVVVDCVRTYFEAPSTQLVPYLL